MHSANRSVKLIVKSQELEVLTTAQTNFNRTAIGSHRPFAHPCFRNRCVSKSFMSFTLHLRPLLKEKNQCHGKEFHNESHKKSGRSLYTQSEYWKNSIHEDVCGLTNKRVGAKTRTVLSHTQWKQGSPNRITTSAPGLQVSPGWWLHISRWGWQTAVSRNATSVLGSLQVGLPVLGWEMYENLGG